MSELNLIGAILLTFFRVVMVFCALIYIDYQAGFGSDKNSSKKVSSALAENKKPSTFAPAFEREQVLKNGLGESGDRMDVERLNKHRFEKR